ncbi:hypothetical protein MHYP_G00328900 [Metynnis hypsauchen]
MTNSLIINVPDRSFRCLGVHAPAHVHVFLNGRVQFSITSLSLGFTQEEEVRLTRSISTPFTLPELFHTSLCTLSHTRGRGLGRDSVRAFPAEFRVKAKQTLQVDGRPPDGAKATRQKSRRQFGSTTC